MPPLECQETTETKSDIVNYKCVRVCMCAVFVVVVVGVDIVVY